MNTSKPDTSKATIDRPGAATISLDAGKPLIRCSTSNEHRIVVPPRELMPRLRALAAHRQISMAALMRIAILPLLEEVPEDSEGRDRFAKPPDGQKLNVRVIFTAAEYALLKTRAKASAMSHGRYLGRLMAGDPPPPLPKDLRTVTSALMASNDRLAALSVDINAFLRLLNHATVAELAEYRDQLRTLPATVRAHLEIAATMLTELEKTTRPR